MYTALYQYLLQHKQLLVPGVGTFLLNRKAAVNNFSEKLIYPPSYSVVMQSGSYSPSKQFYNWLGYALSISDRDAVIRFNDFAFDLKKNIADGGIIDWRGVGILSRGLGGEVKFLPGDVLIYEQPVPAEKVIREKAEHMVRVGEDHKTSAEMVEMLNQPEDRKLHWWAIPLAIVLLATMFIGWYFSEYGLAPAASANGKILVPGETPVATYRSTP
ncbi:MAG: hypothetical protein WBC06_15540 [Chitinophagaceae bacterium]